MRIASDREERDRGVVRGTGVPPHYSFRTRRVWLAGWLLPGLALAQTQGNPFDKAPPGVEDALRARANEFYKDHVTGKYRQAEQLVAEDSKDGFYAAAKPDLKDFKIGDILYSDNFTKAKVTIIGKMMMTFMGLGSQLMDVPFPSYWKIDEGKWCWYILNDPNRMTPFGKANPRNESNGSDSSLSFKPVDMSVITSAVKADRRQVTLGAAEEKVILTNSLPGAISLALSQKDFAGFDAKLDKTELKGGETAVLTIKAKPVQGARSRTVIGVMVQPMNQMVQIEVK